MREVAARAEASREADTMGLADPAMAGLGLFEDATEPVDDAEGVAAAAAAGF